VRKLHLEHRSSLAMSSEYDSGSDSGSDAMSSEYDSGSDS